MLVMEISLQHMEHFTELNWPTSSVLSPTKQTISPLMPSVSPDPSSLFTKLKTQLISIIQVYFVNTHDPNPPSDSISLLRNTHWPKWNDSECCPPLLTFFDPSPTVNITPDTYRSEAMKLMNQLLLAWYFRVRLWLVPVDLYGQL